MRSLSGLNRSRAKALTYGLALVGAVFLVTLFTPRAGAQELHTFWKFGLNLGFNEARMTCRTFEHPKQAGLWIGGGGSCQGAWSDFYSQVYLRNPEMGDAWVRLDTNLFLSFEGERRPSNDQVKVGNSSLFLEAGKVLGRDGLIWGGKRGYKREDLWVIGMVIVNEDAPGFGLYNFDLGNYGRLAAAFFHSVSNQSSPMQTSIDLRLEDIPLGDGRLNLIDVYTETGTADARNGDEKFAPLSGNKVAVIYKLWTPSSSHQSAIVYGHGLFGGMDSEEYEQGPLIDSTGAWRNYTVFLKGYTPELRQSVLKSSTLRLGHQFSYYPSDSSWQYNVGVGVQRVDFGGLRFQEGQRYYNRVDMDTFAAALKMTYTINTFYSLEPSLAHIKVVNGLGYRHRSTTGDVQESLRPVDQRLSNVSLNFNIRPVGRSQQNFSIYVGRSYWNDETRRDIAKGYFPERTAGSYAGISTFFEM